MNQILTEVVEAVCLDLSCEETWGTWKNLFQEQGIEFYQEKTDKDQKFTSEQVKSVITQCVTQFDFPEGKVVMEAIREAEIELSPAAWAKEYARLRSEPPLGKIIKTVDGSPVRIGIYLEKGRSPILSAQLYVPDLVCSKLAWLARGEYTNASNFWRAVLTHRSRDEALNRFDLSKEFVYVKSVRVLQESYNRPWLICEIEEWL